MYFLFTYILRTPGVFARSYFFIELPILASLQNHEVILLDTHDLGFVCSEVRLEYNAKTALKTS